MDALTREWVFRNTLFFLLSICAGKYPWIPCKHSLPALLWQLGSQQVLSWCVYGQLPNPICSIYASWSHACVINFYHCAHLFAARLLFPPIDYGRGNRSHESSTASPSPLLPFPSCDLFARLFGKLRLFNLCPWMWSRETARTPFGRSRAFQNGPQGRVQTLSTHEKGAGRHADASGGANAVWWRCAY